MLGTGKTITFATYAPELSSPFPLIEPRDETILNDVLYLTDNNKGNPLIRIVDVSAPDTPNQLVTFPMNKGTLRGIAVSDDHIYTSVNAKVIAAVAAYDTLTGFGTLQIIDVTDPRNPKGLRGTILAQQHTGVPFDVKIVDQYAIVATLLQGIQIVDLEKAVDPERAVSDSAIVFAAGEDQLGGPPIAVDMVGGKVYALSKSQLTVFDANLFPVITPKRTILLPNGGFKMQILAAYTFEDRAGTHTQDLAVIATGGSGKLEIYNVSENPDVTDPPMPVRFNMGGITSNMAVNERVGLLLVNQSFELTLLDFKRPLEPLDPTQPTVPLVLGKIETAGDNGHTTNSIGTHFSVGQKNKEAFDTRILDHCRVKVNGDPQEKIYVVQNKVFEAFGQPNGTYSWTTDNSSVVQILNKEQVPGLQENQVSLLGLSPGEANITVHYTCSIKESVIATFKVSVFEVAMNLEQIGDTVISEDGKYSEDTTVQITAVVKDTVGSAIAGEVVTEFDEAVFIRESGAGNIYAQNNGDLPGQIPGEKEGEKWKNGVATFVAKSLAGPKVIGLNGAKPDDATIKALNFESNEVEIKQWVLTSDIEGFAGSGKAFGSAFAWVDARVRDIYTTAGDDLKTVLNTVQNYRADRIVRNNEGIAVSGLVVKVHKSESPMEFNPFILAHRINSDRSSICGYNRNFGFTNTFIHEARHAYQNAVALPLENDRDRDFLVQSIDIAPKDTFIDTGLNRKVCDTTRPGEEDLKITYKGDVSNPGTFDTFNGPDWAIWALEEDAYRFAND